MSIVELHGGKITVRSEVDHSSSFRVDIPYREELVVRSHVLPKETHNQKSIVSTTTNHAHKNYSAIILFGDDTQANITTIFNYLEARGYRTILVKNDEECVNITKKENPDLILVDIPMSDIDKIAIIKLLRADQQLQYIPIIAFHGLNVPNNNSDDTSNSDKQIYRNKCIAMGANEYFTKPVKLKILLAKIQDLLTQHLSLNMPH
nr:response regulator [Dolichospermum sp. UHCC 0259]